ncbi:MAG: ABC transporter ATP-binding protein, partial [Gammaproteobacteria bacterium]|nr:ABC transporter ATP-binding protein [Gammaproteobacteria bacterium]
LGMTIVVVTHELESAFKIADRIVVLDRGSILTIGTVDEVRASDNVRVQHLLNRTLEEQPLDPEAYLARLTGSRWHPGV